MYDCKRGKEKSSSTYVNRFNGTVARYVNEIGKLRLHASKQFAITMLRNENLTSDTMNTVTFQLTTQLSLKDSTAARADVDRTSIENLTSIITESIDKEQIGEKEPNGKVIISPEFIKNILQYMVELEKSQEHTNYGEHNSLSIENTAAVISQVVIPIQPKYEADTH